MIKQTKLDHGSRQYETNRGSCLSRFFVLLLLFLSSFGEERLNNAEYLGREFNHGDCLSHNLVSEYFSVDRTWPEYSVGVDMRNILKLSGYQLPYNSYPGLHWYEIIPDWRSVCRYNRNCQSHSDAAKKGQKQGAYRSLLLWEPGGPSVWWNL